MPRAVTDIQDELQAKRTALHDMFEKAKTDSGDLKMSAAEVEDVRTKNKELDDLGKELDEAKELDTIYQNTVKGLQESRQPATNVPFRGQKGAGTPNGQPAQQKSLGERMAEAQDYLRWKQTRQGGFEVNLPGVDVKTLMETTAGFAPETMRTGRVVYSAQRRPVVADLIPQTTTTQAAVVYMEETTFTNAADTAAEAAEYAESALAFTERTDTVRKISTFLPVTDEQMDDVPQMQSIVNNRLMLMLMLTEETQLISGSGVAPDLTGFLNKSGIQTQAKGADPVPDAFYKAITKVRFTGFADPTGIIMHPNDWQDVRLLRTTDGIYIWGNPSEPGPERMWGLQVVVTTAETENTGLVGDFQLYSEIFRKMGISLKVSDSHSDYFIKGKQAIRADERLALAIYRAAAFCTVTGI